MQLKFIALISILLASMAYSQSPTPGARTVLNNPKVQTDIDMSGHRLLNFDASNVPSLIGLFSPQALVVDAVNGNDSTGVRGRVDKPFKTLSAAHTASSSGDEIHVLTDLTGSSTLLVVTKQITVDFHGHKISVSEGTIGVIQIGADRVTIKNFEINGNLVSSVATPDNGVIEISSTNSTIDNGYVHDAIGYALRPITSFSGLTVRHFRGERVQSTINTASVTANVDDLVFQDIRAKDNRDRGFHLVGDVNHSHFIRRPKLTDIDVYSSSRNTTLGVELFGGVIDAQVENVHSYNYDFGFSCDHCVGGTFSNIFSRASRTIGIEFAGCQGGGELSNYQIDGKDESGTQVGGGGVGISNSYSSGPDTGPFVIGTGLVTNLATGNSFDIQNSNNVLVARPQVVGNASNAGGVLIKNTSHITFLSRLNLSMTTGSVLTVDCHDRDCVDIGIIGNEFAVPAFAGQLIALTSTAGHNINQLRIINNNVPAGGFFNNGYVSTNLSGGGTLTNVTYLGNTPTDSSLQSGFPNAPTNLNETILGTLTLPGFNFYTGTGDGASYSTYDTASRLQYGWALIDIYGSAQAYFDGRNGIWDTKGGFKTNGNPVPYLVGVPASASASGSTGQWSYDSSYIYVCISTNTWKRVAMSTW